MNRDKILNLFKRILDLAKSDSYAFFVDPLWEELSKADTERLPTKVGDQHESKPYVGKVHSDGRLSWYYNKSAAAQNDQHLIDMAQLLYDKHPHEHKPLLRKLVNHVLQSATRHAVPARDKTPGPNKIRARHIKALINGSHDVKMNVLSPTHLSLSIQRHGQNQPVHQWTFSATEGEKDEQFR